MCSRLCSELESGRGENGWSIENGREILDKEFPWSLERIDAEDDAEIDFGLEGAERVSSFPFSRSWSDALIPRHEERISLSSAILLGEACFELLRRLNKRDPRAYAASASVSTERGRSDPDCANGENVYLIGTGKDPPGDNDFCATMCLGS